MPTIHEILRKACKANGVLSNGSPEQMLARLSGINKKKKKIQTHKKCTAGKCTQKVAVSPYKNVKNSEGVKTGVRLKASTYFYNECDGKIKSCQPQWILQANGEHKMKKIKMCKDAWGGMCPKWVSV